MLPDREWREGKQREAISTDISYTGPGEAVRALVCGFASPIRQKRLLLMLQAFIDDSGSEPGGKVFVLAGLLSTASQWEQFSDEWAEICGQEPAIADFHMARAYRIKGGYWGDGTLAELTTRRDAKILALAEVVRKYAVVRVSSGVTWRAYEAAARGKVPPEIDSPYFFLFWYIIQAVARWQEGSGRREKVDFIFDDQGKIGITAVSWYPYFLAAFTDQERSMSMAEQKGPPRRYKKGPLGGCGLVPVVHGRAPRATRRALNRLTRRRAREGPVGPRGQAWAGWSVQLAVGV